MNPDEIILKYIASGMRMQAVIEALNESFAYLDTYVAAHTEMGIVWPTGTPPIEVQTDIPASGLAEDRAAWIEIPTVGPRVGETIGFVLNFRIRFPAAYMNALRLYTTFAYWTTRNPAATLAFAPSDPTFGFDEDNTVCNSLTIVKDEYHVNA